MDDSLRNSALRAEPASQHEADTVAAKPIAWMRRWAYDGETPAKVLNANNRWVWPYKFKLLPVTQNQCLRDDVPLIAIDGGNVE